MSNPLPNALALSTINDGDQAQAAPLRNNYSAIQSFANLIRACLAGGSAGQLLQAADGTDVQWVTGVPLSAIYRKTTPKVVVNSIAETDLLNGEITVAANIMSTNRTLRLTAWGDGVNNSGANQNFPTLKFKLGATTYIASFTGNWAASATRFPWRVVAEITNLGAANSQWANLVADLQGVSVVGTASGANGTGEGTMSVIATANVARYFGANSGAVDTTLAQVLALTVTLPAANAALDMTLKGALVEIV